MGFLLEGALLDQWSLLWKAYWRTLAVQFRLVSVEEWHCLFYVTYNSNFCGSQLLCPFIKIAHLKLF
jgi:hypothetical protein